MILTATDAVAGDVMDVRICGMFRRADGDHKFVAIGDDIDVDGYADLRRLPETLTTALFRVYPGNQ